MRVAQDATDVRYCERYQECTTMLLRRQFLLLAAGAAVTPVLPKIAAAGDEDYPSRPVRLVVGYAPGGVSDILGRMIGQKLSERLGQPFVVENRPGAGGNVGADEVVHSPPDGYTLLLAGMANAINVSLYPELDFNFAHDMAPVAIFSRSPMVMELNPSFPAKTVPEFIAYAKADPGSISQTSGGIGVPSHLSSEVFKRTAGISLALVPYRGAAPALIDLLGGRVQVMFDPLP